MIIIEQPSVAVRIIALLNLISMEPTKTSPLYVMITDCLRNYV
jgi:hypothetical protein